jgi:hypothetical protein
MLMDFADILEGGHQIWRCLGCGREILPDPEQQAEDERLQERIRNATGRLATRW